MHSYSINFNIREKSILCIFVMACVIELSIRQSGVMEKLLEYVGCMDGNVTLELIIYLLEAVIPISLYECLKWIYSTIIWKFRLLYTWHKIPDFSGKWTGWIDSPLKDGQHTINVIIKQDWNKISIETRTDRSEAISCLAEIEVSEKGETYLNYAFDNIRDGYTYRGFNSLRYYDNKLSGEYFTNKRINLGEDVPIEIHGKDFNKLIADGMGSKGTIVLQRCR